MENTNQAEGQKCLLDICSNFLYLEIIFSNFNRNLQIIHRNIQKYNLTNVSNLFVILYAILVFSTVNSATSLGKENIYYPHAYQPAYERAYEPVYEPPQYGYDDHKVKHNYPDSHYYLLYYLYYFWHWFWSNIVNNIILIIIVWFIFRLYYRNRFT
jgi:hypothetical protein